MTCTAAAVEVGQAITTDQVEQVADGGAVAVDNEARDRCARSEEFLRQLGADQRMIYGFNTGFGPLAHVTVNSKLAEDHQKNLIAHLASGLGAVCSARQGRAILFARLNSLCLGYSAVRTEVLDTMTQWLANGLAPAIPLRGTVGASGDLTPLAHLALVLMGDDECYRDGILQPTARALAAAHVAPLRLGGRDALGIVNGTSAMTGLAALNDVLALRLWNWAIRLGAFHAEIFHAHASAMHPLVGQARPQPGIVQALEVLGNCLDDSPALKPHRPIPSRGDAPVSEFRTVDARAMPQDPYSIRCIPQILGAAWDVLQFHRQVVTCELNSCTDNPIFDADRGEVVHAGNFQGQHVAFASDTLVNATIQMAVLAERQLARLTDPALNNGLPAFLQGQDTGFQSGFMGAQVTATATVAEMRTLALPASCQSIPTNANNQDVVSMGTIAARKAASVLDHCTEVLAIQALALAQAAEITKAPLSNSARGIVAAIRRHSPFLETDRPLRRDIVKVAKFLATKGAADVL